MFNQFKLKFNQETICEMCRLYTEGVSSCNIAEKFGTSSTTVRRYLKHNNVLVRKKYKTPSDIKQEIIDLYNANVLLKDIGDRFGLSSNIIEKRLRWWKVKRTGRGRRNFLRLLGISEQDVINKYIEFKKDITKTRNYYNVGILSIKNILNKHGIGSWRKDLSDFIESKKEHILEAHKNGIPLIFVANELGITDSTIYNYCRKWGLTITRPLMSSIELKVRSFLIKSGIEHKIQYEIDWKKFDFYLPNIEVFIETNGDYWHGNPKLYKQDDLDNYQVDGQLRDLQKIRIAQKLNKKLLFIWEDEINNKWDQVKAIISNLVNHIPTQKNQFDFLTEQT